MVRFLLDDGHNVTVLDNLEYGAQPLLRYVGDENFDFNKVDVRRTDLIKPYMSKADVIVPLACLVGFPLCEQRPTDAKQVNFEVNKWIADNKSDDQMLIYPCTNSGYGVSDDGGVCTEESPLNPISLYGITKVDAERVYQDTEGCITLRLATVFGPSSRARTDLLVNNFVLKAIKDRVLVLYECEFMRNYIHIWDICRVYMWMINNFSVLKNETYNVGNDSINMNKLQLAQKIAQHTPVEIIKAEFTQDPARS